MIRTVRALPLLLLLPALLTACGTEKADAGGDGAAAGTGKPEAGRARESAPAPARSELDSRLRALGIAPELVYVTDVPGFTLAQQSVGVNGDDGFSVAYWAKNGAVLHLYAERGSAADCPGGYVCREPVKGRVVRLGGEKVAPDVVREAADAVHRPSPAELAGFLPPAPTATAPVERGDLPSYGDGAPDNSVGEGG
ncbi:membrane lipoprotein [Streptomyces sp. 5-8]|uniref:Membrane lipoprotein n=1 Tax=Streptomyces musisoli TaxID=2802280 RepID=A0ABS1NU30_9ACTN|nr:MULTISPECIES: membrane lipoprotein [Streptomyces]MBL1103610.1 membrane lipoprotein [Streptomyces musisoli]MBY8839783.1 membrane lipoprotein [Streptomyces sp. SP2-10]